MREFSDEVLQYYPFVEISSPPNWERVTLLDISSDISSGFASGKHNSNGTGIPHLRPMNVSRDGQIDLSVIKSVVDSSGVRLSVGDVLFNNTNSSELVGKTAVISRQEEGFAFSNHMTRVRPCAGITPSFLALQLHFLWMTGYMRHRCTNHVNQASVSSKVLANTIPILLPPSNEQTRIVTKLEELLTDLDVGVAELKTAQKKLSQYRQSLLKTAVEGTLTAEWRENNPPTESGTQLLERILLERRARWEAKQLAKFTEQGKKPPKDWQKKYPEPVQPDTTDLPQLPQDWIWVSIDQIVSESSYGTSVKCNYESKGTPVLRIPNVSYGSIDLQDIKFATTDLHLDQKDFLAVGDVLIIRTNGSIGLVGRAAAVIDALPSQYYFASYLLRLRCTETSIGHRWLLAALSAHCGREWLEARAASSAGQHNISLSTLLMMPIPLPPREEQHRALTLFDEANDLIIQQEEATMLLLKQCAAQRQNILCAAFTGRLVPQNPSDEAANVLLERIRAQRAEQAKQPKPRRTKNKKKELSTVTRKLVDVLTEASDWLPAQDAFQLCGIADSAQTEEIEMLYAELRVLDKDKRLLVDVVMDEEGRKIGDRLKLVG
ncbi:restriction endonuclease subunit S [Pectobacterium carotovorum]|uniref:restriction endonuclease subunit S n=1 Tax=Pectobacterium carotovorum TaxID=554 RepID=UPI00068EFBAD|nr:restriction endonuclease subunit S [Pectobacterium carotovorum]SHG33944.1 type I restriction enzyme, S subunit [Pectobacterium carotovorum]